MQRVVVSLFLLLSVLFGAAISILGFKISALALVVLIPLPLVLRDYRVGVVLLALLLPVSFALPTVKGFNVINILTALTLFSLVLKNGLSVKNVSLPPIALLVCFILPTALGAALAMPHTYEIARNYRLPLEQLGSVEPLKYAMDKFLRPVLHFVGFAVLLANAVRDSKSPERFVVLFGLASVTPALLVIWTVAHYPGSLTQLVRDREFMQGVGMHANEFGMSLALAAGPLLFVGGSVPTVAMKWFCRASFALVSVALVLTFSRGGFLAYAIAVVAYLTSKRQFKTVMAFGLILTLSILATPEAVRERFGGGLRAGAISDATGSDLSKDELTAGRVHGWVLLAPEVLKSPIVGSGIGSTQWSAAVASRRYKATHPHNIYLEILMDLGVVGFCLMSYLFYVYLRTYRSLSASEAISPQLRAFFFGSRWSLFGILAMAATHGFYMPNSAQAFMWYSLGFMFAYFKLTTETKSFGYMGIRPLVRKQDGTGRPSSRSNYVT